MVTIGKDAETGHVRFQEVQLEDHVASAIDYALGESFRRNGSFNNLEITAGDVLAGVLTVVAVEADRLSGTSAFRSFIELLPTPNSLPAVHKIDPEFAPDQLRYEAPLAASLVMALEDLRKVGRPRFWGRDLVTATLLADSASLERFAQSVGANVAKLRDQWFEVLERDPNWARQDLLDWWSARGFDHGLTSAAVQMINGSRHPLETGIAPNWTSGWGDDVSGPFVVVDVDPAILTLRWIPPGRFKMGSSREEEGRSEFEGPETEITFSEGFWLMDTPVTQALWSAVMGENPSRFQDLDRPVEHVSFQDAQAFIGRLNERVSDLHLRLPSESEWEYACRAGTEFGTYAGQLEIEGQMNAPVLDAIAWYGGNSGVEYDLVEGSDSSEWPDKQYPHTRAGTRKVRLKAPNAFGCYDMLGNVWEWCADAWSDSHEGADAWGLARQASQQDQKARQVIRGGSWDDDARDVRAAFRDFAGPGVRNGSLSFRCARGQASSGGR